MFAYNESVDVHNTCMYTPTHKASWHGRMTNGFWCCCIQMFILKGLLHGMSHSAVDAVSSVSDKNYELNDYNTIHRISPLKMKMLMIDEMIFDLNK